MYFMTIYKHFIFLTISLKKSLDQISIFDGSLIKLIMSSFADFISKSLIFLSNTFISSFEDIFCFLFQNQL